MSTILGLSKYKRRNFLLREKAQKSLIEEKKNPIAKIGHDAEEQIRPYVNHHYKFKFIPTTVKHDNIKYMHSSLDGLDTDRKTIWECKLTGKLKYGRLYNNIVPQDFYFQIQYQLYITGYDKAFLTAIKFNPKDKKNFKENIHKEVKRNDNAIDKIILPAVHEFYKELQELKKKLNEN